MLAAVAIYRVEVVCGIRGDTGFKPVFCLLYFTKIRRRKHYD